MFGSLNPQMKGGLARLQQVISTGQKMILRGPPKAELQLEAGDASALTFVAGANTSGNGGSASLTGGASTTNFGGAANLVGGAGVNAGAAAVTGGQGTSGAGGAASLIGGTSAAGSPGQAVVTGGAGNSTTTTGAKARVTGGAAASAVNAVGGDVEIKGGSGGNGGRGGHVLIQPGESSSGTVARGNIQLDGGIGAALLTTATTGFVTVPTCAGAPSGVPTGVPTGSVATVVDTTNLRAYFYISGTWRYATLT